MLHLGKKAFEERRATTSLKTIVWKAKLVPNYPGRYRSCILRSSMRIHRHVIEIGGVGGGGGGGVEYKVGGVLVVSLRRV